jgi:hypothetical protein
MKYESLITCYSKDMANVKVFEKWVKLQGQGHRFWYQLKGLVIRNTHVKYESPITYHSKDMANVKVFADRQTNRRTGQKLYAPDLSIQGHKNLLPSETHCQKKCTCEI